MRNIITIVLMLALMATSVVAGFDVVGINDNYYFYVTTTNRTGAAADADGVPTYRCYEHETGTNISTGSMAKLDDAGTLGFYSEGITVTATHYTAGNFYSCYITATVVGTVGVTHREFYVTGAGHSLEEIAVNIDDIETDTGTTLDDFLDTEIASILADTSAIIVNASASVANIAKVNQSIATTAEVAAVTTAVGKVNHSIATTSEVAAVTTALNLRTASVNNTVKTVNQSIPTVIELVAELLKINQSIATTAELAAVDTKIDTIDNFLDTEIASILADTGAIIVNVSAILIDTGTTLDDFLDTEIADIQAALIMVDTTIGSDDRSTTTARLTAGSDNNDAYNGMTVILDDDAGDGEYVARTIVNYVATNKVVTWAPAISEDAQDGGQIYIISPGSLTAFDEDAIVIDMNTVAFEKDDEIEDILTDTAALMANNSAGAWITATGFSTAADVAKVNQSIATTAEVSAVTTVVNTVNHSLALTSDIAGINDSLATTAELAAIDTKIDTIDNFIDTEVASILADTGALMVNNSAGVWETATGFSTSAEVLDARDDIILWGEANWTTGGASDLDATNALIKGVNDTVLNSRDDIILWGEANWTTGGAADLDATNALIKGVNSTVLTVNGSLPTFAELIAELLKVNQSLSTTAEVSAVTTVVNTVNQSIATTAEVTAVDDFVDTEVAAILADTGALMINNSAGTWATAVVNTINQSLPTLAELVAELLKVNQSLSTTAEVAAVTTVVNTVNQSLATTAEIALINQSIATTAEVAAVTTAVGKVNQSLPTFLELLSIRSDILTWGDTNWTTGGAGSITIVDIMSNISANHGVGEYNASGSVASISAGDVRDISRAVWNDSIWYERWIRGVSS